VVRAPKHLTIMPTCPGLLLDFMLGDWMMPDSRRRVVDSAAADFVRDAANVDWMVRHDWVERLAVRRPILVARIYRMSSPDFLLYGEATGCPPPEVIALPDKVRTPKRQAAAQSSSVPSGSPAVVRQCAKRLSRCRSPVSCSSWL
jgi:hypothetical protein